MKKAHGKISKLLKKTLAGFLAAVFLSTSTLSYAASEQNTNLAPSLRFNSEEFKTSFTVAAICKHIERDGNLDDEFYLNDVLARIDASKNPNITVLPYEIIIEIPGESLAVRYFDPTNANVITPYSDISKLETKVIGPRLNRQIIHRIKELAAAPKIVSETSRIVSFDEMKERYRSAKTNDRGILVGFMRDHEGKIQPVFSDSAHFKSSRVIKTDELEFMRGPRWNPERVIREIPATIKKAAGNRIRQTPDWNKIPLEIREIFEGGNILVTSKKKTKSPYSVLMSVTPASEGDREEGRTGILLKDGVPIIIEISGKEFVLEIKGVGAPEGGYDHDYRFLRGGVQVEELNREYDGLESKRAQNKTYSKGDTTRAVGGIEFNSEHGVQGYILRLAPGSIRSTYNENNAFSPNDPAEYSVKTSYAMGKQMGEFYSQGFIPCSHPENLIVVNKGEDFIFTDYSDIIPIRKFPTKIESQQLSLFEAIRASLKSSTEMPGYDKEANFKAFLQGLATGLEENGKISAVGKKKILSAENFDQVRDVLWEQVFAVDYYLARKAHGWTPEFLQDLETSITKNISSKLVKRAREKCNDNKREIAQIRNRLRDESEENEERIKEIAAIESDFAGAMKRFNEQRKIERKFTLDEKCFRRQYEQQKEDAEAYDEWREKKSREIGRYEAENEFLESTGFTARGMIRMTNSDNARRSFENERKTFELADSWSAEHSVLRDLWEECVSDILRAANHLKAEIDFLKIVLQRAGDELKPEVAENLHIATKRLEDLQKMTPHEYYLKVAENHDFPKQISILPYCDKSRQDDLGKIAALPAGEINKAKNIPQSDIAALLKYIEANKKPIENVFGGNKQATLVRVPIESIEGTAVGDITNFIETFQKAPNGYVELYYMSGIGEVSDGVYQKYGLQKKSLPKDFERSRENTLTLFPAFKGEKIDQTDIVSRLGSFDMAPENTILSPIGLQHDPAGLVRAAILGLKMMDVARQIKEKGKAITNDQVFKDAIQLEILEQLKNVCDAEDIKNFNLTPDDIIALAAGDINDITAALKKLIKLLPIEPINAEELRDIYEHAQRVMQAA